MVLFVQIVWLKVVMFVVLWIPVMCVTMVIFMMIKRSAHNVMNLKVKYVKLVQKRINVLNAVQATHLVLFKLAKKANVYPV